MSRAASSTWTNVYPMQLSKFLKKVRSDLRQLAPQRDILETRVGALEKQIIENEAKYGLLERSRVGKRTSYISPSMLHQCDCSLLLTAHSNILDVMMALDAVVAVIEQQQAYLQENVELRERLILKDMTINELKEVQSNLEQALTEQMGVAAVQEEKAATQIEAMRRHLKQEENRAAAISAELTAVHAKLRSVLSLSVVSGVRVTSAG